MQAPRIHAPNLREWLFSAKAFAASMLALYVALAAGLPRPFWAMMTAYIVASPLSGAVRSKALFRVCGTIIGSIATVLMVPPMANAPELLSLALACWVGLCLYVSLLDRTPRSYIFMLAGYTAGLIGFPAVSDPGTVFDTAVARVEEICVGILAATVVHSLVLPQGVGPALVGRLDRAIGDAQRWMMEVLRSASGSRDTHVRLALAGEISDMRVMSTHLPFDTSHLRWTAGMVHALHDRLTVMVPLLLAVEDRLQALAETGPLDDTWQAMLADVAQWIEQGKAADPVRARQLRDRLQALAPELGPQASWRDILHVNLAQRLGALVAACEEGLELRGSIDAVLHGAAPAMPAHLADHLTPSVLNRDRGMALRSALAAVIAILACCTFWIVTAWPSGAAAPMMAGVFCCFFATMDDPVPAIKSFVKFTLWSMPVSAFYILVVLPAVHSYEMLVLTLAPVFLVAGAYMARPATMGNALAFLIGVAGTLALQDTGPLDMTSFSNGMIAQMVGYLAAGVVSRLVRTVSGGWMAQRMLARSRDEVAQMAKARSTPTPLAVSARVVDRIGLLMPRLALAKAEPETRARTLETMRELRAGLHIAQLRGLEPQMAGAGVTLRPLLEQLGSHVGGRHEAGLLAQIDATLRAVCRAMSGEARQVAAAALASMRRDLFPRADAFEPTFETLNPELSR